LDGFEKLADKCVDVDECKLDIHECQANSYCVNRIGSYKCRCKEGYHGNGVFCQDIDECDQRMATCPSNSHCLNTPGSYVCDCSDGFRPENNTCVKIRAQIEQTKPPEVPQQASTQTCRYRKPKEQFTYCKFQNNCDPHSDCIYDTYTRTYSCRCWTGYIGNGYVCYGNQLRLFNFNFFLISNFQFFFRFEHLFLFKRF
jgi:hypothetical protein